jgi:hypothetical protein
MDNSHCEVINTGHGAELNRQALRGGLKAPEQASAEAREIIANINSGIRSI